MENWIWSDSVFCKGAAWIDLLLNAHFQNGAFQSKKGKITYNRGDCTYSLSDLARRWNWSRGKVRSFLGVLEEHNMIKRKMAKEKYSIITILNYDKYQGKEKVANSKNDNKKDDDGFDYDRHLRFLLGDEYDEYMENKNKA